jgi:transposase
LLLDRASAHTAAASQALAARLRINLVWLPKQTPELSPMDQLWRELKRVVAANRQAPNVDALATSAMLWVVMLSPPEARRKSGMLSPHFWLRNL